MFMNLEGLRGEAQDAVHKNEIDVIAWSWSMTQSGSTHTGYGGGAGKVEVHDLEFTKYVDLSSPSLLLACCNGKHIPQGVLTIRKAGGTPVEYLRITMIDILVTGIRPSSRGQTYALENVSLQFAKFKVEYRPQKADGSADAPVLADWDIAANAKLS
jgi:type VI secretion system secreted protein Hcp